MQQRVFVGNVVVVAGKDVRGVVALEANKVGNLIAVKVENIVDSMALLQQEL